jgi:hypothetical protein
MSGNIKGWRVGEVDLLSYLEDKLSTTGNLTDDESKLYEDLLDEEDYKVIKDKHEAIVKTLVKKIKAMNGYAGMRFDQ